VSGSDLVQNKHRNPEAAETTLQRLKTCIWQGSFTEQLLGLNDTRKRQVWGRATLWHAGDTHYFVHGTSEGYAAHTGMAGLLCPSVHTRKTRAEVTVGLHQAQRHAFLFLSNQNWMDQRNPESQLPTLAMQQGRNGGLISTSVARLFAVPCPGHLWGQGCWITRQRRQGVLVEGLGPVVLRPPLLLPLLSVRGQNFHP
jgi:hypothetical protein